MNVAEPDTQTTCFERGAQNNSTIKFCGSCGSKLAITIIYPYCGEKVPDGTKFYGERGKPPNASKCPSCGLENKPGMEFCGNCGERL